MKAKKFWVIMKPDGTILNEKEEHEITLYETKWRAGRFINRIKEIVPGCHPARVGITFIKAKKDRK
jgi:hypothetical protein